ncbi:hypothetical protein HUO13_11760 [Saccharopolyspora erythraea]|uniref:hypothetical protein n=1 Tax=Saccharopolyspora erythraea TaxID=1836 RepID=UPI001BA9100E|nr:hypothetical protein [Saccharopolyspora erythraea]QUH01393.1 hypothetical protein HUO13_11760 [Saccharopolyspora erythraea]
MTGRIAFARLVAKPGIPERERVCHAVPIPDDLDGVPVELPAYCGVVVVARECEWSLYPAGMPCMACMISAPAAINAVLQGSSGDGRSSSTRTP